MAGCSASDSPAPQATSETTAAADTGRVATLSRTDAEQELCLRVADEPIERRIGLSLIDTIAPFDGMLFVFDAVEAHRFWMKDTRIPLELVAIRGDGNLGDPIPMQPCPAGTPDCPTYGPDFEYDAAIELDQGRLESLGMVPSARDPVGFALTGTPCSGSVDG